VTALIKFAAAVPEIGFVTLMNLALLGWPMA
jgi:hypothetical protein